MSTFCGLILVFLGLYRLYEQIKKVLWITQNKDKKIFGTFSINTLLRLGELFELGAKLKWQKIEL